MRMNIWPRIPARCLLVVLVLATACASLPPAKPAGSLKDIAGTWEGSGRSTVQGRAISWTTTLTIKEDGTWENIIPGAPPPGPRYVGTMQVVDGKYRWKSNTSGQSGVVTLHEGEGRRVLVSQNDAGDARAEYTLKK